MMVAERSTHSLQMQTAGPATSLSTAALGLSQNEQDVMGVSVVRW
jgi:hypothetical protein